MNDQQGEKITVGKRKEATRRRRSGDKTDRKRKVKAEKEGGRERSKRREDEACSSVSHSG